MSNHSDAHGDAALPGHDDHLDADAHGAHGALDVPPEDAAPRTPLAALIWPLIILGIVLVLVLPAVAAAFAHSGTPPNPEPRPVVAQTPTTGPTTAPVPTATVPAPVTLTAAPTSPTLSTPPTAAAWDTAVAPTATAPPPTDTPVAILPPVQPNQAEGALRQVEIGGQTFKVEPTTIVEDWVFSTQPGVASWISGTLFNYIVGLPYNDTNAALFRQAKVRDPIRLTVANGQTLSYTVSSVQRVARSDTSALAPTRVGVTLLLLGEPADDRAVISGQYVPQALTP